MRVENSHVEVGALISASPKPIGSNVQAGSILRYCVEIGTVVLLAETRNDGCTVAGRVLFGREVYVERRFMAVTSGIHFRIIRNPTGYIVS